GSRYRGRRHGGSAALAAAHAARHAGRVFAVRGRRRCAAVGAAIVWAVAASAAPARAPRLAAAPAAPTRAHGTDLRRDERPRLVVALSDDAWVESAQTASASDG